MRLLLALVALVALALMQAPLLTVRADSIAASGTPPSSIVGDAGSSFDVSLSVCTDAANMVLTVDVATRVTAATWYGKGQMVIAAAGCATRTVTVTITNAVPTSASIMLHAWLVSQADATRSDPWNYQTSSFNINVAVQSSGSGGSSTGPSGVDTPVPPSSDVYPTSAVVGKYDYKLALDYSLRFFEGQRAGTLPASNRIAYRGNSVLNDGSDATLPLSGGWFDAGDHVKFSFPMAYSAHILALGVWAFKDGYAAAGQLTEALSQIKWATDFFIASHPSANSFAAQVGKGDTDHAYWGRPEDLELSSTGMPRPTYMLSTSKPGSDLAGAAAAALAAMSVIIRETNSAYADSCVTHAAQLYSFGKNYLGTYSQSVPDAAGFYSSGSYHDDLTLAAAWLHIATANGAATSTYLTEAESRWSSQGLSTQVWAASWDSVAPVASTLLWRITGKAQYATHLDDFINPWLPGGSLPKTAKGLAFRDTYGSLRYATTTALVAFIYGDSIFQTNAARSQTLHDFAVSQCHYALGDNNGFSYLVGFGSSYPLRPHHRAASCPLKPAPCGWDQYNSGAANPQVLIGALVGGPSQDDSFNDQRGDYIHNEVTTDYNAGFTGALARLAMEVAGPANNSSSSTGISSSSSSSSSSSGSNGTDDGDDGIGAGASTQASFALFPVLAVLFFWQC